MTKCNELEKMSKFVMMVNIKAAMHAKSEEKFALETLSVLQYNTHHVHCGHCYH